MTEVRSMAFVGAVEDAHAETLGLGEEVLSGGGTADDAVDGGVEFEGDDGVVVGDGDGAVEEGGVLVDGQLVEGVVGGIGEERLGELLDFEAEMVGGGGVGEELSLSEREDDGVDDHRVEGDVGGVGGQRYLGVERGGYAAEGGVVVVADDAEGVATGLEGVVEFGPGVVGIKGVVDTVVEGGGVDEVDTEVGLLVGAGCKAQGS